MGSDKREEGNREKDKGRYRMMRGKVDLGRWIDENPFYT